MEKLKSKPGCHGRREHEQGERSFQTREDSEQTLGKGNMAGVCVCLL